MIYIRNDAQSIGFKFSNNHLVLFAANIAPPCQKSKTQSDEVEIYMISRLPFTYPFDRYVVGKLTPNNIHFISPCIDRRPSGRREVFPKNTIE